MDRILQTARLELRPTSPALSDGLWAAIQRSLPELSRWMSWAVEPREAESLKFTELAAEAWSSGRDRHFTILHDGVVCGQCSLDHVDPLLLGAEIGYWIRSDLCGRGFMTEAASAVVGFGFASEGLHRIELHAGVENVGSQRVAEKLGFQKEGVARHDGRGIGGFHDSYVYGLLSTDPRPEPTD